MYNVGDKYTSKYFTPFEIVHIFQHYKGTIIITYNTKGEYSARSVDKFDEFLQKGKYEMNMGQVSLGTTL